MGNEALKKANEMFSIEEIESIMDDSREAIAKQQEIDALISGQLSSEDEDEVLAELEALGQEIQEPETDLKLPDIPTEELPGTIQCHDLKRRPLFQKDPDRTLRTIVLILVAQIL